MPEDLARWRTLSGSVLVTVGACITLVLSLGGPAWLKAAAAAIAVASGASAVVLCLAEWRARSHEAGRVDDHALGKLYHVPPLPVDVVPRNEFYKLREMLLREGGNAVGITGQQPVGLHGRGGIGKTVLAAALARDAEVRRHFPDGVFWVTVGEHGDPVKLQIALLKQLGTQAPEFRTPDEGARRLEEALAERRSLVVVDDVWTTPKALAFRIPGPSSRVLYTTRKLNVLDAAGADVTRIGVLSRRAALQLLADLSHVRPEALPPATERVFTATGGVALALALVGAAVGRGGASWEKVAEELERSNDTFLAGLDADVFKAMQVAVAALDPKLQEAYRALAVYPADTRVPIAAIARLWVHRNDVKHKRRTRTWLKEFAARKLLVLSGDAITFHDLPHAFLLLQAGDARDVRLRHDALLAAYRTLLPSDSNGSAQLPRNEPYIWEHLIYHLRGTGDGPAVITLIADLAYLTRRYFRDGPYAAESDLRQAATIERDHPAINWLQHLFAQWGHAFTDQPTLRDLAALGREPVRIHQPLLL